MCVCVCVCVCVCEYIHINIYISTDFKDTRHPPHDSHLLIDLGGLSEGGIVPKIVHVEDSSPSLYKKQNKIKIK